MQRYKMMTECDQETPEQDCKVQKQSWLRVRWGQRLGGQNTPGIELR